MVRARKKNVNPLDCTKVDGVETKYHPTQRQTEETMDGHTKRDVVGCAYQGGH